MWLIFLQENTVLTSLAVNSFSDHRTTIQGERGKGEIVLICIVELTSRGTGIKSLTLCLTLLAVLGG